jgi:hypothetical protein
VYRKALKIMYSVLYNKASEGPIQWLTNQPVKCIPVMIYLTFLPDLIMKGLISVVGYVEPQLLLMEGWWKRQWQWWHPSSLMRTLNHEGSLVFHTFKIWWMICLKKALHQAVLIWTP